jgi:hypothetical protein
MDGLTADPQIVDSPEPAVDPAEEWIDEALAPFQAFVGSLAVATDPEVDESLQMGLFIEKMKLDLPFEMDVLVDEDGKVHLAGAPPTQQTETSFLPVFHRMRLELHAQSING